MSTTISRASALENSAACSRKAAERWSFSAVRSSSGCETKARASLRLKGPTICGVPGKADNPNAARLFCCTDSVSFAETLGSNLLSAFRRAARAERTSTPASTNPKFCRSPRSKASFNVSGKSVGLALPAATLPVKLPVVIPEDVAGGSLEGNEGACEVGNEAICAGDDAERPASSTATMPRRFSLRCFLLAKSTIVLSSRHHQFGEKDSLIKMRETLPRKHRIAGG